MSKIKRRTFLKRSFFYGMIPLIGSKLFPKSHLIDGPSKKTKIAVAQGENYFKTALKAVEELGGIKKFVPKGAKVAVLANPQRNNPGAFTSPKVVSAVIDLCKQAKAKDITFISWLPEKNWKETGLLNVIQEAGVKLKIVNLRDESLFKPVPIKEGIALKEARIMKEFFNHDCFINVPITKDHAGNKFTGTLKNLMGLNSPVSNRTFHKPGWKTDTKDITHLDQSIADLNLVIKPALCIVDATEFIITNGPFGPGEIQKSKKVIAGTDRVAVDSYCCTLWGLKPEDIIMINKAHEHKLGEMNLSQVTIKEVKV